MREIDEKLAEALRLDDESLFEADDTSLFEEVWGPMRGRRKWFVFFGMFWSLVFAALAVTGIVMFFRAEADSDRLVWGFLALIGMVVNGLTKIWYWMEMHRWTMLREIKRVEFQVARLAERVLERLPDAPDGRG